MTLNIFVVWTLDFKSNLNYWVIQCYHFFFKIRESVKNNTEMSDEAYQQKVS